MSKVRRAFYLQFLGLLATAIALLWLLRTFPLLDYVLRLQRKIGQMEFWGALLYPLLFGTCNVLLLPGGVIAVGSGLFFGLWWGFLLNLAGTLFGAAVAFGISRKLGRQWIERRFFGKQKWIALDQAIARDGWKIIFWSQIHPLFPTSLLNYLYGVTRIRFGTCLLWVGLGQAPGLFLYAYLGTLLQLGIRIWNGQTHPLAHEYVLWLGGLVLAGFSTVALARMALRLLAEAEAAALHTNAPFATPELKEPAPSAEF